MGRKKNLDTLKRRQDYLTQTLALLAETDTIRYSFEDELDALNWALKKLEAQEIGVGDRVKLRVFEDEDSDQPEQGTVIGYSGDGFLIRPATGPYSGPNGALYYPREWVTLVDP